MQSFIAEAVTGARYPTPDEVQAEIAELCGGVQGIDQDNLGTITVAKVEVDGFGEVITTFRDVVQRTSLTDAQQTGESLPIPDNAGATTPWVKAFTCGDGMLHGTLSVTFYSSVAGVAVTVGGMWVGVELDGALVAISPNDANGDFVEASYDVAFAVPIGAGSHRLAFVYGYVFTVAPGTVRDIDWDGGTFVGQAVTR